MAVQPIPIEITSELDKYVSYGDNQFIANIETTITGSTETPAILIKNPLGSGKFLKIKSIEFSNIHTVVSFIRVRIYKNPTVSVNGTVVGISSPHIGSTYSSSMQVFSSPTVTANGTRMGTWACPGGTAAVTISLKLDSGFLLDPNQSILITGHADGTNRVLAANIVWIEG